MSAYLGVLYAHSYLRWVVLALALSLCAICSRGLARGGDWTRTHERLHSGFVAALDLQFTLGLLLYFWLSPFVRGFYASPGIAMKDAVLRFFGVEHVFSMLIAIAIIHIARVRSKRAPSPRLRQRGVLLSTVAAFLLILIAIPWPFLPYGRPIVRL